MEDEKYIYQQEQRERKIISYSAKNARSHCGKRGAVKLPSDYLTKKELESMNSEVKSYRLNDPMTWQEFKALPDDIKIMYIKLLRERFDVSDMTIANTLFHVDKKTLGRCIRALGIGIGAHGHKSFKKSNEWYTWIGRLPNPVPVVESAAKPDAAEDDEPCAVPTDDVVEPDIVEKLKALPRAVLPDHAEPAHAIPWRGNMEFNGLADEALATVRELLHNANVHIYITWEPYEEVGDVCRG